MRDHQTSKKILSLDRRELEKWIEARLSGADSIPPVQVSKGEEPEDFIVALFHAAGDDFKLKCSHAVTKLLVDLLATKDSERRGTLLPRLTYLADMFELKEAAPILVSFVFREEFRDRSGPYGDIQEQVFRCLLGLNPKQFDTAFWEFYLEQPRFAAVAIRGLGVADPPVAVKKFGRLMGFALSGQVRANPKLVLWRISRLWENHFELLALLADSVTRYGPEVVEGTRRIVAELPFDLGAKEVFSRKLVAFDRLYHSGRVGGLEETKKAPLEPGLAQLSREVWGRAELVHVGMLKTDRSLSKRVFLASYHTREPRQRVYSLLHKQWKAPTLSERYEDLRVKETTVLAVGEVWPRRVRVAPENTQWFLQEAIAIRSAKHGHDSPD